MVDNEELLLKDILKRQAFLETYARRKFPYDPSTCTLYMDIPPRQLLFACLTCRPTNAICYSCGLRCHAEHQIVELYTKRNFRCDCGTTRLVTRSGRNPNINTGSKITAGNSSATESSLKPPCCTLRPNIEEIDDWANEGLTYNHNFEGRFCVCGESVDDEDYGEGAMFQCLIGTRCSEDWFHARCIAQISRTEEKTRQQQQQQRQQQQQQQEEEEEEADGAEAAAEAEESDDEGQEAELDEDDEMLMSDSGDDLDSVFPELPSEFGALICTECRKDVPQLVASEAVLADVNGYVFLKEGFGEIVKGNAELRRLLYEFPFLGGIEPSYTPEEDTDTSSLLEAGEKALQQLPHELVVDGIEKFNEMQKELVAYVKEIAATGRAVTKEDVQTFFNRKNPDNKS